ncbi:MAG TPA: 2-succinyl-5-enolpyruvyl-6-hydroxy-3-cyclohexene-1-carboxylic-acid synthase [Solirubrobacteraceae bacterium]|nr:2-succinyl-5-enolpyruvyl-6-hydroxy-3-cyclohexene-1-carboxylic-acid synthase [Solirubrobacteraceae bacterium]
MEQEQAHDQHILMLALVDELARCGVRHACTSPGSRSTPIVLPLVRDARIRSWSHVDERSAGFFAIGLAKATGRAVVVACTSGTAAANLAPAVHEAREGGVPLIVLTADRPPELREVGAGQVIDQVKLYGSAAKWFFEVGSHAATPERVRWMRSLACRAVWTAEEARPGVVHLNLPFRDPLVPPRRLAAPEGREGRGGQEEVALRGRPGGRPWLRRMHHEPEPSPPEFDLPPRSVVVAGTGAGRAAAAFAAGGAFPLLADPLSGARTGPAAIAHYDALLRGEAFVAAHRPEAILRVGDLPTSKPLRAWLEAHADVEQIVVPGPSQWPDPMSTASALAGRELLGTAADADEAWLADWRAADEQAARAIDAALGEELNEPRVARELGARLPEQATLWVASSMPVRDAESFFPVRDDPPRVLANRGANGIDGTVSAALGAAAGGGGPAVLLIGDVALAHDVGGLLAARRHALALTIVLLNNDGGGIFEFLPVSGEGDAYVEHVATPLGLDFAHAAALYGCAHTRPGSVADFRAALAASFESDRTTIVEVQADRRENRELHRRVNDAVG